MPTMKVVHVPKPGADFELVEGLNAAGRSSADILEASGRYDSICCPSWICSSVLLVAGRASGATDSIGSSVAGERRPCTNGRVEVVVGFCLLGRRMFDCGQHLVSAWKTL